MEYGPWIAYSPAMGEPFNLGQKLRRIRLGQGLTLRELARKASCSPSFVSQIELNQASPTVANLSRICTALRISVSDFLQEEEVLPVPVPLPNPEERALAMRWSGARLCYIIPRTYTPPFAATMLLLEPHSSTPPRHCRRSINEMACVITGEAEFHAGEEKFSLETNQALYYDLALDHSWHNPSSAPCQILLVNGCRFSLFEQEEEDLHWDRRRIQERKAGRKIRKEITPAD